MITAQFRLELKEISDHELTTLFTKWSQEIRKTQGFISHRLLRSDQKFLQLELTMDTRAFIPHRWDECLRGSVPVKAIFQIGSPNIFDNAQFFFGQKNNNYTTVEGLAFFADYVPELDWQREIPSKSKLHGLPPIQISHSDGVLLHTLCQAIDAKTAVEIGVLGGYSASWIARSVEQNGGSLICIECNESYAKVAQNNLGPVANVVDIRIGEAARMLPLIHGPVDLVFIDADKSNYNIYASWAAQALRPGGLVVFDNSWLWGFVHRETREDWPEETRLQWQGMRGALEILRNSRFMFSQIPTNEGMLVGCKPRNN